VHWLHLFIHFFNHNLMKEHSSRLSVLVISTGLLILYLIYSWQWALYSSLSIGITGILSSYLSRKIDWLWMSLARFLGIISQNVLLTIIFYLILFPVSLLSKIFSKSPVILSGKQSSFFCEVTRKTDRDSFEKPW
jgi:hypothetical protein